MVYDDDHIALWERGKVRRTPTSGQDEGHGLPPEAQLREAGVLPKGGIARFYGTAEIHKSGAVYERSATPRATREGARSGQEGIRRPHQGRARGGSGRAALALK